VVAAAGTNYLLEMAGTGDELEEAATGSCGFFPLTELGIDV
jgi:hypothetical protein